MSQMARSESGFTVVEISIFLAISALLLLVAFIGTGTTLSATRFTDSVRSLQSYFQEQYSSILNGVNERSGQEVCDAATGQVTSSPTPQEVGQSSCLLLGRLIQFQIGNAALDTYYVVGTQPASIPPSHTSSESILADYSPRAVQTVGASTFEIPWGATIQGTKDTLGKAPNSYLWLRSPSTGEILSYAFYSASGFPSGGDLSSIVAVANRATTNVSATICVKPTDGLNTLAMISLTAGGGQGGITTTFDLPDTSNCDGVSP